MKYSIFSCLVILLLSGCIVSTHDRRKTSLKQEIEVLELKKRKAILQVQIEKVESIEIEGLED